MTEASPDRPGGDRPGEDLERGVPDPEAFFARLSKAKAGRDGYGKLDRYRDFRRVFLSGPEGERVLWQIFEWCRLFAPTADLDNVNHSYFREGGRNIGLRILATLNAEPPESEGADRPATSEQQTEE